MNSSPITQVFLCRLRKVKIVTMGHCIVTSRDIGSFQVQHLPGRLAPRWLDTLWKSMPFVKKVSYWKLLSTIWTLLFSQLRWTLVNILNSKEPEFYPQKSCMFLFLLHVCNIFLFGKSQGIFCACCLLSCSKSKQLSVNLTAIKC